MPIQPGPEPSHATQPAMGSQPDELALALTPASTERNDQGMMLRFESLGRNCEFGLVQRHGGAEPLGLLRFSSTPLESLIAALDADFANFGTPDTLRVELNATGTEYMVKDIVYGLYYHAWVKADEMTAAQVLQRETRRLPLLLRKFREDLAAGHKLFVYQDRRPLADAYRLLASLRRFGPNRLLFVTIQDRLHPPGSVAWGAPGFMVGYLERFAPDEDVHSLSVEPWLALCRQADRLAWPSLYQHPEASASPAPAPQVLRRGPRAILSTRLAYRLQQGHFTDMGGAGKGCSALHRLEAPPHWVRLFFANDRPAPLEIDGAAVAGSSAVDDGVTPINANGEADLGLWRRVTFNAGGADSEPLPSRKGDAWRLTIPPHEGPPAQARRVMSDWIPLPGIARNDHGRGALLHVRSFASGVQRQSSSTGTPDPALDHLHLSFWCLGDPTRAPWQGEWHAFASLYPSLGLQFISALPGATVLGIGDRTMQSHCSAGGVSGFGMRACAMVSRPDLPVSWFSETVPGATSEDYAACGAWAIETLRPQVVLIPSWCETDLYQGIDPGLSFARAMALADLARRTGGIPILLSPPPVFAANEAGERWRQANLRQARDTKRGGMLLLDLDALWGTGGRPNAYQPEFDSGDHRQQNEAGDVIAAKALARLLVAVLE